MSFRSASSEYFFSQIVTVRALPGEHNQVSVALDGDVVRVEDRAGVTAGARCSAVDAFAAVCAVLGTDVTVSAELGDGDDTFATTLESVGVDGGAGADELRAGSGEVRGGPGDDRLVGGTVVGGPGADLLQGGTISYADHIEGITVDLAGGVAGAPGEGDVVVSGSGAIGGSGPDVIRAAAVPTSIDAGDGDDVLVGSPQLDTLDGGLGSDVVRGGGGDDHLFGGLDDRARDRNRLDGGAGADYLLGGPGSDVIEGGPGRDHLAGRRGRDVLRARDGEADTVYCEEWVGNPQRFGGDHATLDPFDTTSWCRHIARSGPPRLEVHALTRAGSFALRPVVSCPRRARVACRGRLRVREPGFRDRPVFRHFLDVHVAPGCRIRPLVRLPRELRSERFGFELRVDARDARGRRFVDRAFLGVPD